MDRDSISHGRCVNLEALPEEFRSALELDDNCEQQIVCDYIAGMTDNYAVKKYQEIFVPEAWNI